MSNFVDDCINGDVLLSEIDQYIDKWHEDISELAIYSFLGMTKKEYGLFVLDPVYLASIIKAHRENINIENIINVDNSIAARSDSQAKAERLQRWLKSEGLWD